jgi:nucleoside-diphosphate-sugar epimerase
MLRVAVLGANGFIGSRTVEMLHLGDLAEVRPVVRSVARLARPARFDLDARIADGFDQTALSAAFRGCDVVVHAIAGDSHTILGTLAPAYRAAQEAGVQRFIYLSTASVHGQVPEPGTDERSPLHDRQPLPYNNAKVQAERTLHQLRCQGSVELVLLRPGIVFGPRSFWVTQFVETLLRGQAYFVNDGRGICNSTYVDNLIHALYLAMKTPGIDKETFLVGDKERVTWAEFYQPFAEALGYDLSDVHRVAPISSVLTWRDRLEAIRICRPVRMILSYLPHRATLALSAALRACIDSPPVSSPWEVPEVPVPQATLEMSLLHQCGYKLPSDKAKKRLGYEPIVSFAEGCRRTIAWLAFVGYPVARSSSGLNGHPFPTAVQETTHD